MGDAKDVEDEQIIFTLYERDEILYIQRFHHRERTRVLEDQSNGLKQVT
jgi:hypothetical protein